MRIVFATTQSLAGSTMIGRVLPLAEYFSKQHDIHILGFSESQSFDNLSFHQIGTEPFTRTSSGKKRLSGLKLVFNIAGSIISTTMKLWRLKPDVVIVIKTLPHNVIGVRLWQFFHPSKIIIIDVDDFELTANKLTSLLQRLSIHFAERMAMKMAACLVSASPFLQDHFSVFRPNLKTHLIPTGITAPNINRTTPTSPTLIFLGSTSISSGHRVDLLPDILSLVHHSFPQTELIIAGSGDDTQTLKKSFAEKKLSHKVTWHGRFSQDQLSDLLSASSLIIDPIDSSISNRAKSSFRVSLAIAAGIPVVSSNVGLRPKLLPRKLHHRLFAIPGNPSDYAKKVVSLLSTPLTNKEVNSMKKAGSSHTWSVLAKKYLSIIEQC